MIERSFEFYSDVQGDGPTANRITVTIEIKTNHDHETEWVIESIYDETSQCNRTLESFDHEKSSILAWCEELACESECDAYSALLERKMDEADEC